MEAWKADVDIRTLGRDQAEALCDDTTDAENPRKRNGYWWTASRFLKELGSP